MLRFSSRLRPVSAAAAIALLAVSITAAPMLGAAAPTAAAAAPSGNLHVSSAGVDFNASLPPSSVATYTWTPGTSGVHQYVTTTSGTALAQKLQQLPDIALSSVTPAGAAGVSVDAGTTYQTMTGFGAALTDSAATLINQSPAKAAIMNSLFGAGGARLNFVRVPMGASDLVATNYQSYDDSATPDPDLTKFSIAHDATNIIPILQQAKSLQPGLKILATPWSAPGWMKTGGSFYGTCGGSQSNSLNPTYFSTYASYFVKFAQAYAANGLPLFLMSMQNEPQNCITNDPTMTMTATDEITFASKLRPALTNAGLGSTGILAWDHNWYDQDTPKGGAPTTYPQTVATLAGGNVSAIGYHCYNPNHTTNAFDTQTQIVPTYMTECSGFVNQTNSAANLVNELRDDLIGPVRNGSRGSLYWSLALGNDGTPHGPGGCGTCRGMIGIDRATGSWAPNEDYYYWAQFSKFVDPGAVRIASTASSGPIQTVAFRNPNGTIVLVALNAASSTNYAGHIVQWDGDTNAQKTSWLLGPDGQRRWINNTSTYNCLKTAGAAGPNVLPAETLDAWPDLTDVWAVCGSDRIGVNSMLQTNTYARSQNGKYTLKLTSASLSLSDSAGHVQWSTGTGGDDLTLRDNGNLIEYAGSQLAWSSNTAGSGGAWLVVTDGGKLILTTAAGKIVWTDEGAPQSYIGHLVQWDSDSNGQKTSWLVGPDGQRRWINSTSTYSCLKGGGAPGPDLLTSWELDQLPNLANVWAVCGADRIGLDSVLQPGAYARSVGGTYTLRLTATNLTLTNAAGAAVWSTGVGGTELLMDPNGNLIEYAGQTAVWASNTAGSGGTWLVVGDDGKLALYDTAGKYVWTSEGAPVAYAGHIVQWAADTNTQKTSWLVTPDGHRNWIPDAATYNCLKSKGTPGPNVLTSWELNQLPDQSGTWAQCH